MSTSEIIQAISNISEETLKNALKSINEDTKGNKNQLIQKYADSVVNIGLKNFISKLNDDEIQKITKILEIEKKDKEENKKNLLENISEKTFSDLLNKADDLLLNKYCEIMGLEKTTRKDMIQQLLDEVMLTVNFVFKI